MSCVAIVTAMSPLSFSTLRQQMGASAREVRRFWGLPQPEAGLGKVEGAAAHHSALSTKRCRYRKSPTGLEGYNRIEKCRFVCKLKTGLEINTRAGYRLDFPIRR